MFSKRHYEAIAEAIQEAKRQAVTENEQLGVATVMHELANTFARDNGQFNKGRFVAACEPGANVRARTAHLRVHKHGAGF